MRLPKAPLLSALLALGTLAPAAHAQFGVAVGANFDKLSDVSGDRDATFKNASGYHVGVFIDLPLGPLALRPGLYYTDIGSLESESVAGARESIDIDLVEVPIDVRYRLLTPLAKPYVSAGPVLRFAQNQGDDDNVDFEKFTLAGSAGLGIELSAAGFKPFIEARYQFGIQKLVNSFELGGVQFETEDGAKLNTFMLRAGLTF